MGLTPLTPEILVPKLGDYLVYRQIISAEDLQRALHFQQKIKIEGKNKLLGQILVDMGMLTQNDLDQSVTEQILQLRNALQDTNAQLEERVRQRTAELEKALTKLSELSGLKANFIANISHELRTPLTHLKGYLELMQTGDLGKLTDEVTQAVEVMTQATKRLEKLINDLILYANAEKGKIPLEIAGFNLGTLVKNIITRNARAASEKNIRLFDEIPENDLIALGDIKKIDWVINELIENAIKFTGISGKIIVGVEPILGTLRFFVQDYGIGIATDKLDEVFEPFHQLDGSSTRKAGGTGLGLSLAQQIMQAHKSEIKVKSEIHKGSEFSFILQRMKEVSAL